MNKLLTPLTSPRGKRIKNRFMLVPLTNTQIDAERVMSEGADWIMLGRVGILHHDFPKLYEDNPRFSPIEIPVSVDYLLKEGLSDKFINYISKWGFISELSENEE